MRLRLQRGLPLFAQLLMWLLLNLLLISTLFLLLPGRNGIGWDVLLTDPVRDRLLTIGDTVAAALANAPDTERADLLQHYAGEYGVTLSLHNDMPPPGGGEGPPPGPPPDGHGGPMAPPAGDGPPPPADGPPNGPFSQFTRRRQAPVPPRDARAALISIHRQPAFGGYTVLIPVTSTAAREPPHPVMLSATAPDLRTLLRFLGVTDWVVFAALVILTSAVLWAPFMLGITRTVMRLQEATLRIAEGRFDARVASSRRDELGQLAESINQMAERLAHHVDSQKQFLADVAHEITSPLARMQMGLGILESQIDEHSLPAFHDIQEDVQQMSLLLDELLLYSRADLGARQPQVEAVELSRVVNEVLTREDPGGQVHTLLEPGLCVRAAPQLLTRALANLVRNALRHATDAAEPVTIKAAQQAGQVTILVGDRGPGVPDSALPRLGEAFFRPEAARSRDTGGSGLGLAIVCRCIAACDGEVRFRNRRGGGFEAEIRLAAG